MKKFKFGLAMQIIAGLILGITLGAIFYGNTKMELYLTPVGDIFIRLIKMIVIPIILSSIIVGVAGVGDIKKVGKLGGKTILYFEIITTIAIIFGLVIANVVKPGTGINIKELSKVSVDKYLAAAGPTANGGFIETLINIVPNNIFEAFTTGNMISIIFISVIFGLGIAAVGKKGEHVLKFFEGLYETMFWITNQVMKLAPLGVFALIGVTVSKFGLKSLISLGNLALTTYGAMILFIAIVFGTVSKIVGINIISLIKNLKEELILAYTTASSETVLIRIIDKMEKFGCPRSIVSFVIPTGYSFNLDGSTLYEAIAAIFIAQMYGINLTIVDQINLVLVLMITSKGIAGVPGVSFVVMLATLGTVGIPIEGLAFIAGIDRILDMARTVVNVIGNSLAAVVVSKWEGQFRQGKFNESENKVTLTV